MLKLRSKIVGCSLRYLLVGLDDDDRSDALQLALHARSFLLSCGFCFRVCGPGLKTHHVHEEETRDANEQAHQRKTGYSRCKWHQYCRSDNL